MQQGRLPLRVALIGFGAIGTSLHDLLSQYADQVQVLGVLVRETAAVTTVAGRPGLQRWTSLQELLNAGPDMVVECAGHSAVHAYGDSILRSGIDLLPASVGALADPVLHEQLIHATRDGSSQLVIAAGAVGGLDALSAARMAGLTRVLLRSRKPPLAWQGTEAETVVDLATLQRPTVLFRGSARQAALAYPKNANVAATVALATLGFDKTQVELMADPSLAGNSHEIQAESAAGQIVFQVHVKASPSNPKTSVATAYSLASQLLKMRTALAV